ncbi:MAG TPA: ferrochelatase [Anaeromyxobacteraceae bacterium]|nr:ferrochelatase [Anaeromyxobacteraceae bacterium]
MNTAVFLMNLGGPRTLGEVEPYLRELFSDVLPAGLGPLRGPLAGLIAKLRAPSSKEKYRLVGGRSPLVERTQEQARALASALGGGFSTHVAMRCGHPSTAQAVQEALVANAERAVALPLYPQWANVTTRSSLDELRRLWPGRKALLEIGTWHDHPGWLDAVAATAREAIDKVPGPLARELLVLFSAHGLPMAEVNRGDKYPRYVEASAKGVAGRCGLAAHQWLVTYQSRLGPLKWLGPDTVAYLRTKSQGRAVVAVPISFVSEHLETLYDLDILARDAARRGGAAFYARARAVGARPDFIAALKDIVCAALQPAQH